MSGAQKSSRSMPVAGRRKTWGQRPAESRPHSTVSPTDAGARPSEPADDRLSPGDVIGNRYLLTSLLGMGGMGAIWLARDLKLDIDVALKFIQREHLTEINAERLLQEARAVARLDHPSIVRIFDFGETEDGEPFMSLEVLRGELLIEVLERKGRLAALNAVSTLLPVASAVAAAHAKGVVHRDLKPENILLVTNEQSGSVLPKVLDFGIAQLRSKGRTKRITENDAILGTPDYMSPEQASGIGEVDARADVWALCVVLYEAITGKRPFQGQTAPLTLIAIATKAPTPTHDLEAGDPALWRIIERGLEKDPQKRVQTMRELGVALARWAVDNGLETDVAGTSLAVHWLAQRTRSPLSDSPPPPPETPPAVPAPAPSRDDNAWPPRVLKGSSPDALQALVEPVTLPPELSPGRRWRWMWLLVIILIAGAFYALHEAETLRALWGAPGGSR